MELGLNCLQRKGPGLLLEGDVDGSTVRRHYAVRMYGINVLRTGLE